jgi:hypothetical protein
MTTHSKSCGKNPLNVNTNAVVSHKKKMKNVNIKRKASGTKKDKNEQNYIKVGHELVDNCLDFNNDFDSSAVPDYNNADGIDGGM